MTRKLYLEMPSLTAVAVIQAVTEGREPTVVLSQTLFHPQTGGRMADSGALQFETNGCLAGIQREGDPFTVELVQVRVIDVRLAADAVTVLHVVDDASKLKPGMTVILSVDPEPRRLHSLFHSAGRLLAGVVQEVSPGLIATAGRYWPEDAWIEFEGQMDEPRRFEHRVAAAVATLIGQDLPITIETWADGRRHVAIGGAMRTACGGTHARRTSELLGLRLISVRWEGGVVRIGYDIEADGAPRAGHPSASD